MEHLNLPETAQRSQHFNATGKPDSVPLIDRLMIVLQEEESNLSIKQRAVLKMAISLLDQIDQPAWDRPEGSFRVSLTREEYSALPGKFELIDGQPM